MASKGKSNSDDRHTHIIDTICELYDKDSENEDFFRLLESEIPKIIEVEENGEKKTKAVSQQKPYILKNSPEFQEYQNIANSVSISNQICYPDEVESSLRQVYRNSTENIKVYLGFFQQAGFFYCIIDNQLFLFSKPKRDNNIDISFDSGIIDAEDRIQSCDIGFPDPNIYDENVVSYILYISTQNSIKIYPIGKTCDKIYETKKVTKQTSFIPTCIKAYHSNVSYFVFVGSDSGDIYGLYTKLDPDKATIDVEIKSLSSNILLSHVHTYLNSATNTLYQRTIIFLAYDTTTSYLASVDYKSNINFYKFDIHNKTLKKVSTYEPQTEESFTEKIVSINEIPISDSKTTRFVCITESGDRLFFGTNQAIYLDERIERSKKLYVPEYLAKNSNGSFHSGCFYLSNSFFVSSNSLVVMRPCYRPHKPTMSPPEIYEIFDQLGEYNHALSLVVPDHPYKNQSFTLFYHDLLWQHIMPPQVCYLMCTNGFYEITLNRPVDKLNDLLTNTNEFTQGIFSNTTRNWMSFYSDEAESAASAILLASEVTTLLPDGKINQTKMQQNLMKILYSFSASSKNMIAPTMQQNTSLSKASAGFAQRATRLLSVIWDVPVLTKDSQNKYCLSPIFRELPSQLKVEIKKLILLTEEYKKNRYSTIEAGSNLSRERKEELDETQFFEQLTLYLNDVIEMIQFIKIVISHAKIIDKAMQNMDQENTKKRLQDVFGSQINTISLFDALRDLAAALLREDPNIFSEFSEECPRFFSSEDKKIIEETNKLKSYTQKPSQSSLNFALKTYIKYIGRPFKLDPIVELFQKLDFKEGIIKLCLQRAHVLDLEGKALKWFKGNRSNEDEDGRLPFDKRYRCYEFIFDLAYDSQGKIETINKENLNEMLKSTDELFHLLLYDWILRKKHLDDLLDLKTPFIENFLKENLPDSIWIYNSRNGKYTESAIQLLEIIKNKENKKKISDRLVDIQHAKTLSQADNNKELVNEVTKLEKYCLIQLNLLERMENEKIESNETIQSKAEYLMEPQELFQECCEHDYWDFVLKILSMSGLESKQNEASRKTIISKVWSNYFNVQLWNQDLNTVRKEIGDTCRGIDKGSDVIDPAITMPVFEEFRLEKNMDDPIWAARIMVNNDFNCSAILKAYLNAYDKLPIDCDKSIRLGFISCIFYLATDTDANLKGTNFDPLVRELSSQSDNPFKQNAESLLENWRKCYKIISEMQTKFLEVFHYIPDPNQLNKILDNVKTLHNKELDQLITDFRKSRQTTNTFGSTRVFKTLEGTFQKMFNNPVANETTRIPKTVDLYQFLHNNWELLQPVFIQNPRLYQKQ